MPRHTGTPPFYLHNLLVQRWAERRPDAPALAQGNDTLTYADLWSRVRGVGAGLAERLEGTGWRVALVAAPGIDAVAGLLGAGAAHCVTLLADPDTPAGELSGMLDRFGPDLILADERGRDALRRMEALPPLALVPDLAGAGAPDGPIPGGPAAVRDAAFALPISDGDRDGLLAYHSHYSLMSGAVATASFFQVTPQDVFAATYPHWTWEGLYSIGTPLLLGGTAVVSDLDDPDGLAADIQDHEVTHLFLPFEEATDLGRRGSKRLTQSIRNYATAVLLSTPQAFRSDDRRRLQKTWDVPLLTVWGWPETGAAIASHASWYLDEAVGIPITSAEVQPAEPDTGRRLETAWELLEYAAIVVKSPLAMLRYDDEAATARRVQDGWFNSAVLSTADANGMVYLLR